MSRVAFAADQEDCVLQEDGVLPTVFTGSQLEEIGERQRSPVDVVFKEQKGTTPVGQESVRCS